MGSRPLRGCVTVVVEGAGTEITLIIIENVAIRNLIRFMAAEAFVAEEFTVLESMMSGTKE